MKLVANKYCASITPRTFKTKPKKRLTVSQLKCNGDNNFSSLTKTTSTLFGKRLWEMRHEWALYASVLHHISWKLWLPLDLVNYLNYTTHLIRSILGSIREVCPQSLHKEKGYMTEWIRTMIVATNGSRIGSIKTLILNPPLNPRSTNYDLRHHLNPKCNGNYRHWIFESVLVCSTERLRTLSGNPRNVLWNSNGANTYLFVEAPDSSPGTNTMFWLLILHGYCWLQ